MAPVDVDEGFWGKPTSLIDWCEENYVVTTYIAEFWNTIRSDFGHPWGGGCSCLGHARRIAPRLCVGDEEKKNNAE